MFKGVDKVICNNPRAHYMSLGLLGCVGIGCYVDFKRDFGEYLSSSNLALNKVSTANLSRTQNIKFQPTLPGSIDHYLKPTTDIVLSNIKQFKLQKTRYYWYLLRENDSSTYLQHVLDDVKELGNDDVVKLTMKMKPKIYNLIDFNCKILTNYIMTECKESNDVVYYDTLDEDELTYQKALIVLIQKDKIKT